MSYEDEEIQRVLQQMEDLDQKIVRSGIKLQKFVSRTETPEEKMDERKVSKRRAKFEKLSAKLEARKGRRKDLEKRYNDMLSKKNEAFKIKNPDASRFEMAKKKNRTNHEVDKLLMINSIDIMFILKELKQERKRVEELTTSLYLRDGTNLNSAKNFYFVEDRKGRLIKLKKETREESCEDLSAESMIEESRQKLEENKDSVDELWRKYELLVQKEKTLKCRKKGKKP
ncbi:Hypothetical predicted protein [Olea europaea subsp. europaea]|uniref:Uncharacterized protein n=1 Tax=Olea europaea subsp. europaea TaxID=158383 RepID=A0A8S0S210_OLEEU|nr:Hypothetical predicted protein [Olea europaea subsp. europaea]